MALSCIRPFILTAILLVTICSLADCYDPLDPNGNITVTFDIHQWTLDGYVAMVTVQNYYQFRHVDKPGWKLGWMWARTEVIWSMAGAFAVQQGNCSDFKFQIPHSCKRDPVIVDRMPDAAADNQSENCCHGGVLSAWAIEPSKSFSSFEITVGNLESNTTGYLPLNLTLMAPGPGFTCDSFADYPPTVFPVIGGRREVQVFRTWKSTCTYSSFVAKMTPTCCVSLSSFYNPIITTCPNCSCGCRLSETASSCFVENPLGVLDYSRLDSIVQCTNHMCPVGVHWHIKNNYKDHWRVKLTLSNYNYGTNYSDWNVLVQHPGFSVSPIIYSFNSTLLPIAAFEGEVALFWGIEYYNTELLQFKDNQVGSVTTEIIMGKDAHSFTLNNGWAFPRRVYFNGENCEMPLPDDFPMLPNGSYGRRPSHHLFFLIVVLYFSKLLRV